MVYLPNEIINLILSFRERNPISLLIKDSVDYYKNERKEDKLFSYYFDTLIVYKMDKLAEEHFYIMSHLKKVQVEIDKLEKVKSNIKWTIYRMDMSMLNPQQIANIDSEKKRGFLALDTQIIEWESALEKIRKLRWTNERKGGNFSRFYCDINHSIICCGAIKKSFLVMNDFKDYTEYENKFRNEIYSKCDRKNYKKKENIRIYYPHLLDNQCV